MFGMGTGVTLKVIDTRYDKSKIYRSFVQIRRIAERFFDEAYAPSKLHIPEKHWINY